LSIYFDSASAEVFVDNGLNVFTDVYFPENQMDQLKIETNNKATVGQIKLYDIKAIWR
jgi:sucrose-6-phosphate hydrolase SacC (GH32 family)